MRHLGLERACDSDNFASRGATTPLRETPSELAVRSVGFNLCFIIFCYLRCSRVSKTQHGGIFYFFYYECFILHDKITSSFDVREEKIKKLWGVWGVGRAGRTHQRRHQCLIEYVRPASPTRGVVGRF